MKRFIARLLGVAILTGLVLQISFAASSAGIFPAYQVVNQGETGVVTVKVTDQSGNLSKGHQVILISSSDNDRIDYKNGSNITNANGEARFQVSSNKTEVVTYTAYDTTSNKVISNRAKVAYYADGKSIYSSAGASSGPVDYLEFEDIPDEVEAGDSIDVTLSAYDLYDEVVTNYEGSVRFSVVSDNGDFVELPEDYTFTFDDQGSHTFSLAFLFQEPGQYIVEATDLDDISVFGQYEFDVVEASGNPSSSSTNGMTVSQPIAGTYSNPVQVISGKATAGSSVKIFDNDIAMGTVTAGVNGNFSYTTPVLDDGSHTFYAAEVNDVGTIIDTSDTVTITVDSSAPEIQDVQVEPLGEIAPNSLVTLKLYTDSALTAASLTIDGSIYDMTENPFGYYEASFAAPIAFGDYNVSFTLKDDLGNESKFQDYAVLTVGPAGIGDGPGNVAALKAKASNARVILDWTEATGDVDHYRVYYGDAPDTLFNAVDTFTDSTTWYVPDLENGHQYYFAVQSVAANGNTSPGLSNIVSAIPDASIVDNFVDPAVTEGSAGADALGEMEGDVSDTGPEVLWLFFLSGAGGYFYNRCRKSRV